MRNADSGSPGAISLFTGVGGLDYGFEAAGFVTRVAVDMDRDCCATLRANRPWPVIEDKIESIPTDRLLQSAGLSVGEADVLIGGPPCQPFSKSGYWASGDAARLNDPRARTLREYMRVVEEALPKTFLLENVHGIAYSAKDEGIRLLLDLTDRINARTGATYRLSWRVVNAADYGVPQTRARFFLVGDRDNRAFVFPEPSHQAADEDGQMNALCAPHTRAWDAIGALPDSHTGGEGLAVGGQWADLLPSIPEGENYLWHTNRGGGLPLFGWRTRYWSFLLKLAKAKPSWTIQAQPGPAIGPFHWTNRRLSVREMARLQTLPDDVEVCGGRTSAQAQLGNAVPSLLAEVLARALSEQLLGGSVSGEPRLAVPVAASVPDPEPPTPVPPKYLALVGDHPDHPGQGRGRRARSRDRVVAGSE